MNKPDPQQDLLKKINELEISLADKTKEVELLKAQVVNVDGQKNKDEVFPDSPIYKDMINSITEAIYILNRKWEFIEVNRGAELMYGYSREELIGKTPLDVSAPNKNDIPKVIEDLEYVLKNGDSRSFEFWGCRKNKEIFLKEVIINKGFTNNQDVIIASARDVSDKKRSEEDLDRIFNLSLDMICMAGLEDGYLKQLNPAWEKNLGWTSEELSSKPLIEFLHPDDIEYTKLAAANICTGKPALGFENRYLAKDGSYRWLSWNIIPIPEENMMMGIARDITEQKKAQKALRESEARFKGLFMHSNAAITIANKNFDILKVNEEFEKFLGYPQSEMNELSFRDFTYPDDLPLEINLLEQLHNGEIDNYRIEKRFINKKGEIVWGDTAIAVLKTVDGEIDMYIGMTMDITKNKENEIELKKSKERAEESDRLKSAFLANMSHEIRTPMNGILGFAELLEEPNLSQEVRYQYLNIIKRSGDRMLSTVNDIIDISKIAAGQVKLEKKLTNIKDEINSIYEFFKPEAEKRRLRLTLDTKWPPSDLLIETDRIKLNSIFINLIKNAIKYTDEGWINVSVQVSEITLKCSVTDTGIGIPANRLEAIFSRFVQADIADSSAREGSGLGLAIAKSYVEMLHGEINVKSTVGVGSEFYFQIPLNTASTQ